MHQHKEERRTLEIRRFFDRRWGETKTTIHYDPRWERPIRRRPFEIADVTNEISYCITGIHDDPELTTIATGDVVRAQDKIGRKFLIVATRLGLVAMYCCSKDLRGNRLMTTFDQRITNAGLRPHIWSIEDHAAVIGSPHGIYRDNDVVYRNIGQWMELSMRSLMNPSAHIENVKVLHRERVNR